MSIAGPSSKRRDGKPMLHETRPAIPTGLVVALTQADTAERSSAIDNSFSQRRELPRY